MVPRDGNCSLGWVGALQRVLHDLVLVAAVLLLASKAKVLPAVAASTLAVLAAARFWRELLRALLGSHEDTVLRAGWSALVMVMAAWASQRHADILGAGGTSVNLLAVQVAVIGVLPRTLVIFGPRWYRSMTARAASVS